MIFSSCFPGNAASRPALTTVNAFFFSRVVEIDLKFLISIYYSHIVENHLNFESFYLIIQENNTDSVPLLHFFYIWYHTMIMIYEFKKIFCNFSSFYNDSNSGLCGPNHKTNQRRNNQCRIYNRSFITKSGRSNTDQD